MFLQAAKRTPVDLEDWAVNMMERHNRKSHLAPQLSPSTQALLRGEPTASPLIESAPSSNSKTPTSNQTPSAQDESKPTPTSDVPVFSRISDVNGAGMYPAQTVSYERQAFPPRTSSNYGQPPSRSRETDGVDPRDGTPSYSRDSGALNPTTTLPIRPAPSGPLPPPPNADPPAPPTTKRTVPNGAYPYPGDASARF